MRKPKIVLNKDKNTTKVLKPNQKTPTKDTKNNKDIKLPLKFNIDADIEKELQNISNGLEKINISEKYNIPFVYCLSN